jgi:phosphatidate cytidylyltransferase
MHEAMQSEIFRAYATIVAGMLVVAGVALALMTFVLRRDVKKVWVIWSSWLILAPLVYGAVFLGRLATVIVFTLFAILGLKEFARATGLYRDWLVTGAAYLGIAGVCYATLTSDPGNGETGWYGLFMALPVFVIAVIMLIPILRNRAQGMLQQVSLAIMGFLYIGWMFGHAAFLVNSDNPYGYVLFITFAVAVNDVSAFTFGKLLGRHKLRSNISPNKTWEGSIGALAVSMALPWLMSFSFPAFGTAERIWTGLIVGVGGQLGDLSLGFIKRDLGIKDSGALIPGHGGVLDRINSLIFAAPLFVHMVQYFHGLRR